MKVEAWAGRYTSCSEVFVVDKRTCGSWERSRTCYNLTVGRACNIVDGASIANIEH